MAHYRQRTDTPIEDTPDNIENEYNFVNYFAISDFFVNFAE